jgi:hypothetical protein
MKPISSQYSNAFSLKKPDTFRCTLFILLLLSLCTKITVAQEIPDSTVTDTIAIPAAAGVGKGGNDVPVILADTVVVPQQTDTETAKTTEEKEAGKNKSRKPLKTDTAGFHSPKKAAWMSAVLPGLGQIYNRKYWKLPIIYGGFAVAGYLGYSYYNRYQLYNETYRVRMGLSADGTDHFPGRSDAFVLEFRNYYRRNFELTCVVGGILYLLNVIDASVDAHLFSFDVSEDLSMKIHPGFTPSAPDIPLAAGFRLSFSF